MYVVRIGSPTQSFIVHSMSPIIPHLYFAGVLFFQSIIPHFLLKYSPPNSDAVDLAKTRQCLADLNECWKQLEIGMADRDDRLSKILEFSDHYGDTLATFSGWLDNIQLRLINSSHQLDIPTALREIEVSSHQVEIYFCLCWVKIMVRVV